MAVPVEDITGPLEVAADRMIAPLMIAQVFIGITMDPVGAGTVPVMVITAVATVGLMVIALAVTQRDRVDITVEVMVGVITIVPAWIAF